MTNSRAKGQRGERELAALLAQLTGHPVKRQVRNHRGDADLAGLPGWAVECKHYRAAPGPALLAGWWQQARLQAAGQYARPLLCWRANRWPGWIFTWGDGELNETLSGSPETWWRYAGCMDD